MEALLPRIDERTTEAIHEPLDFARRHRLLLQIHKVNRHAALFEEPLGGTGSLRIIQAEDLNADHPMRLLFEVWHSQRRLRKPSILTPT